MKTIILLLAIVQYANAGGIQFSGDNSYAIQQQINEVPNTYLKLDASNDPITNDLQINGNVQASSFSGDGANITSLNASELGSGIVPNARLDSTIS